MTSDEKKKLYAALSAPFPESCIQRTDGKTTGRGYSTSGLGYAFIVARLNEVLGVGGFRAHRTVTVKEIVRSNGRPAFEAICDLTLELGTWEAGQFIVMAESLADGGHIAASEADARKGAYTNAFKKAAAFHGVGRQAYEGTLDDDNVPSATPVNTSPIMTVVRAPVAQSIPTAPPTPAGYTRTPVAADVRVQSPDRNRISSRQVAALWSLARKGGLDQPSFRSQVKNQFGVQVEFLSREAASSLITSLQGQLNGSGKHGEHDGAPAGAA